MAVTYEALNAYGGPHILCCRQSCEDKQDILRYHVAQSKFRMITFHDLIYSICAMVRQRVAVSFLIGQILARIVWDGQDGMESGWTPTQHSLYFLRTHSRANLWAVSSWGGVSTCSTVSRNFPPLSFPLDAAILPHIWA
jgi:hypothetical protein